MKKFLNLKMEKTILAEVISIIAICILEMIILKAMNSMFLIRNDIQIKFLITLLAIMVKVIFHQVVTKKKILGEIEELEGSNERLQDNYDNVRAFRHDFNNIMQSIGGYIQMQDLNGLEKMYKSIVKECQDINNNQCINREVINNPAIYNLINHKYKIAKTLDITLKVEVLIDLTTLHINDFDLCRILGILLDNAIEATKDCEEKAISIKFIYDKLNCRNLIIIENPYRNLLIDVKKIYEKGFSSKKEKLNHGLGLWKVKQILRKNKNLNIYTAREKLFKQQLEIY